MSSNVTRGEKVDIDTIEFTAADFGRCRICDRKSNGNRGGLGSRPWREDGYTFASCCVFFKMGCGISSTNPKPKRDCALISFRRVLPLVFVTNLRQNSCTQIHEVGQPVRAGSGPASTRYTNAFSSHPRRTISICDKSAVPSLYFESAMATCLGGGLSGQLRPRI